MPANEEQDVSAGAQVLVETDKERFERERLTRRQALRKFGITASMATFAMFSVDDLARMVGKAMQQRAGDNKIARQIAQEFQQAGVALAGGPSWAGCGNCSDNCAPGLYQRCDACAWPCTGSVLRDNSCGDSSYTQAQCLACCKSRNFGDINGESWCVSYGACYSRP